MINLAFLASNNGSSLRAIVDAIETGALAAKAVLVVSNRKAAPALEFAAAHGIASCCIRTLPDPEAADRALAAALGKSGADLVILSGYLRRLGPATLEAFTGRILNIHPALLPDFGGEGMYGRRVHEAVRASGAQRSGASVHIVDALYDHGPVIAQRAVAIDPADDAAAIEAKVMALEQALFVDTLKRIVAGEQGLKDLTSISHNIS